MIAPVAWLKGRLSRPGRSHRVTTITRTVTREKGEPAEQTERKEVVEEMIAPTPVRETALHVSVATASVAATIFAAFVLGWLIRKIMDN